MRISLLLPIGPFSVFAKACLSNISETCGIPLSDFDFVFLTNPNTNIEDTFLKLSKDYQFRILTCPHDYGYEHTKLLDWAVRYGNIEQWFLVQHCDLFWQQCNWLPPLLSLLKDQIAIVPETYPDFVWNGKTIITLHDFLGIYNRDKLLNYNLTFRWGMYKDLHFSEEVNKEVQKQAVLENRSLTPIHSNYFIDGSKSMTLECGIRFPNSVELLPKLQFDHWREFFRVAERIKIEGKTLFSNTALGMPYTFPIPAIMYQEGRYAYFCSFVFSEQDFRDPLFPKPYPWKVFLEVVQKLCPNYLEIIRNIEKDCSPFLKYATNSVSVKKLPINCVKYNNKTIVLKKKIFL